MGCLNNVKNGMDVRGRGSSRGLTEDVDGGSKALSLCLGLKGVMQGVGMRGWE